LFIFYFFYLFFNFFFFLFLIIFSFLTIFFSGLLSLFEKDLKKLVALSTLSQIGFCFFSLGLGFIFISYLHIVRHAFFKSCLFMQVGYILFFFYGQQDYRFFFYFCNNYIFIQIQFLFNLFSLCGLFFSGGFFSKDFIFEYFLISKFSFCFIFFVSFILFFTVCYRIIL
jgi:NADH-ubiquinone oxidoreductase chain 5